MKYDIRLQDSLGRQLEILQELPDKGDTFPTIILVPGFGVDLHEHGYFDDIADTLVKNGFNVVRFSFAGIGKSQGDFVVTTIDEQAQQLRDIVSYVVKDRFTDKKNIGLLAQSFGAAVTVLALPIPEVKSFLFTGSVVHPFESVGRWFRRQRGYNPEGISKRERSDHSTTKVGPEFWKSLMRHNLVALIKKITQPILFIHGSKDQYVRMHEAEEYFNAVPGKKLFQVVQLGDHAFTGKFRKTVLQLMNDWFSKTLV